MPRWTNWSGRHRAKPETLHFIRSEEDAAALVRQAADAGRGLRVAGSGHSHAPLVPTEDVIVDLSGLAGLLEVNEGQETASFFAGTKIHAIGEPLRQKGLGLLNQGDIDRQAIMGAVSTGTHGTGRTLKNFSAGVKSLTLILATGEKVTASETENKELWQAARLGLGAFGLVTRVELQARKAYCLKEEAWESEIDPLLEETQALAERHRHFEFFWTPATGKAFAKTMDISTQAPLYPVGEEGARQAWSYEVLPSHRPHLHTEMEYSVPEENGIACFSAIRDLILKDYPDLFWPVEYRTLAADDVWLSTAFERPTVTLSVHYPVDEDERAYYEACEEIFRHYDGRPHWGKVHYLTGETLASIHPRWADWWRVRDSVDPKGMFLNDMLRAIHPDRGFARA